METSQVVLLVTDKPLFEREVRTALLHCGYSVVSASCAREAMDYVANGGGVELALLDLELPDINGAELADILRSRFDHLHIRFVATPPQPELVLFREFASVETIVAAVMDLLPSRSATTGQSDKGLRSPATE